MTKAFFMLEFVTALLISSVGMHAILCIHTVTTQQMRGLKDLYDGLEMVLSEDNETLPSNNKRSESSKKIIPVTISVEPMNPMLPAWSAKLMCDEVRVKVSSWSQHQSTIDLITLHRNTRGV